VIEGRTVPTRGAMALLAGLGESRLHVVGILRPLEIFQVAADTGRAGQVEVVVYVTINALARRNRVAVRQRKSHRRVIKLHIEPAVRVVAQVARRREPSARMVRRGSRLKVFLMARVALRRQTDELPAGGSLVTTIAIQSRVRSEERESVVVLLHLLDRYLPSAHGVALLAVCSHLPLMNVGVAILAGFSDAGEDGLHVTLRASDRSVHTAQRILRLVMVEFRNTANRLPCVRCVAVLAWNRQASVRTVTPA
jgi:hypothetical protein